MASLITDHTGYVSFSLARSRRRLRAGQPDLVAMPLSDLSVRVEGDATLETPLHSLFGLPAGATAEDIGCRSAELAVQPRIGAASIAKNEAEESDCFVRPNGLSIEDPDQSDYDVSPASFVDHSLDRRGGDCCDRPVPATGTVSETDVWRVIVYNESDTPPDVSSAEAMVNPADSPVEQTGLLWGLLERYRQTWTHLGHSLGEIVYSLALAPGESTQLAVIEWSREDRGQRDDSIGSSERLEHEQRTDRSIKETTEAALREDQGGGSFQAGAAASIPIKGAQVNIGLGGGVTHSWGKRDLSGEGNQNLHQRVVQTSTNTRNQNSTVIVQGRAREDNRLAVRAVANHNHCHALTIQYFEVLRHLALTTHFVDREPAVLVPHAVLAFRRDEVIRWRHLLGPAALDAAAADGFAALERSVTGRQAPQITKGNEPPAAGTNSGASIGGIGKLKSLRIWITSSITQSRNLDESSASIGLDWGAPSGIQMLKVHQRGMPAEAISFPVEPPQQVLDADLTDVSRDISAASLKTFSLSWGNGSRTEWGAWAIQSIKIEGNDGNSFHTLFEKPESIILEAGPKEGTSKEFTFGAGPAKPEPKVQPGIETIDDKVAIDNLIAHIAGNAVHYSRAVWLGLDDGARRMLIAQKFGQSVAASIDGPPLAISGNHVAFRWRGEKEQWFEKMIGEFEREAPPQPEESIVFLPTRGLFAEAMLGHCNACEKRDVTRMWDWTEATVEPLPTLTGLSPGQKGSTVIPDAPQLPGSVLNIQAAPAMPDPSGLAAALAGITQGGIFRDMSGMAEVTSLLKTLSNNASLDQATRQKAAEAAAKIEGSSSGGGGGGGGGGGPRPSARETVDNLTVAKEIAKSGGSMGWTPETIAEVTKNRVEGGGQVTPANWNDDLPSMTGIQDALDISRFRDLFTFSVPQAVVSAAEARGFTNQPLPKYGWGPVNLDEYTIRINKLPKDPVSGVVFTEEEFFAHVRKNFPKFMQPFPRTGQPESLAPVSSNDATSWNSGAPIGSAMLFTIDVPLNPAPVAPIVPERALVICTAYSPTPVQGRRYWNFSTFAGPNPAGYHPVSGTRQFGLATGNGYWEFYSRAADRLGGFLEWSQSEVLYKGQDLYWKYFQAALQKFVRDNQGEAEVQSDSAFVRHFDWEQVNRQLSLKLRWS